MDASLPPDGFEDGHSGNELPPDGFEDANHPGNVFIQSLARLLPSKQSLMPHPIDQAKGVMSQLVQGMNPVNDVVTASQPAQAIGNQIAQTGASPMAVPLALASLVSKDPRMQIASNLLSTQASPLLSKVQGLGAQIGLDPSTYAGGSEIPVGAATDAIDTAAKTALNKVIAPAGQVASAVKQNAIRELFNNPSGVIKASSEDAGSALGNAYKLLNDGKGLSEDDIRLIGKAADRGTGGSQTVYDQVLAKMKDGEQPTIGELIAGRRAASKLSTVRKGMEGYQVVKDRAMFEDQMKALDPQGATNVLAALHDVYLGKTKDAFLSLFPSNQNQSANALRGSSMLAGPMVGALLGHGSLKAAALGALWSLMHSPLATGAATLGASALVSGAKALTPVVSGPATSSLLSGLSSLADNQARSTTSLPPDR